ncbi:serine protease 27-like [Mya arenaria]|uniref:serine protease 27-like n=1 Tax=Mya arenaria TaxID=6604 RepID=UPI0022E0F1B2|nr:serine protease 27-like [Mya arenaria]
MSNHIVGGTDARRGKYPFQVYLTANGRFFCGGSLLDADTVLTAAHCFPYGLSIGTDYQVVAGDYRYDQYDGSEQTAKIRALAKHPGYTDDDYLSADIAVLKLRTSLTFNKHVGRPVTITSKRRERRIQAVDDCWLTGWGLTDQDPDILPSIQQELAVKLAPSSKCTRAFSGRWSDGFVCSIQENQNACRGDSGGPLTCMMRGVPYQVGVVSFGSTNCANGFSAYTRVSAHRKWIIKMKKNL